MLLQRTFCPDGFELERGHKRFGAHWLASELYQELGPCEPGRIREPRLRSRIGDPREQMELLLAVMERMAWLLTVSDLLDDWFDRWERMAGIAAAVLKLRPAVQPEQLAPLWRLAHQLDVVGLMDPIAAMTWAFLEKSEMPAPAGRVLRRIRVALETPPDPVDLHLQLLAWLDPRAIGAAKAPILGEFWTMQPAKRERWRPVLALLAQASLPGRRQRNWILRMRASLRALPAAEVRRVLPRWGAALAQADNPLHQALGHGLAAVARTAGVTIPGLSRVRIGQVRRQRPMAPSDSLVAQTLIELAPPHSIRELAGEIEVKGRLDRYVIHVDSRTVRRNSDGALLELDPAKMDASSRQYMEAVHHGYAGLLMLALVLSEDTRYDFFRVVRLS